MWTLVFDCEAVPHTGVYAHLLGKRPETPIWSLKRTGGTPSVHLALAAKNCPLRGALDSG